MQLSLLRQEVNSIPAIASRNLQFMAFITVFNNIVTPCLATAAISTACFYNVFVSAPSVSSAYTLPKCTAWSTETSECTAYGDVMQTTSYDPPFLYSYKCSSELVTTYSVVFMYTFLGVILISAGNMIYLMVSKRGPLEDPGSAATSEAKIYKNGIVIDLFLSYCILVTFGAA